MEEKFREQIVGKFYTVEDLMNLPEAGCVDPAKAHEVSRNLPIRFWIETPMLIDLLETSIGVLMRNQMGATPEDAKQIQTLILQRHLWIRHLDDTAEEETYIGIFPASLSGDDFDQEEAIKY